MSDEFEAKPAASAAVEGLRAKLLEGLAPLADFAEATERTDRTVYSWISLGMPTEYIGRTPYIPVDGLASGYVRSASRDIRNPGAGGDRGSIQPPNSTTRRPAGREVVEGRGCRRFEDRHLD